MNLGLNCIYDKCVRGPNLMHKFIAHSVILIQAKGKTMVMPELTKIYVDHILLKRQRRMCHCYEFSDGQLLVLSHPEALPWRVKSSGVRQSKITKGTVLAGLGGKGLISGRCPLCVVIVVLLLILFFTLHFLCCLQRCKF